MVGGCLNLLDGSGVFVAEGCDGVLDGGKGFGDKRFYIFLQGFCLGEGRSDSFVHNQRNGHVSKHGIAVRCSTTQVVEFLIMSHFYFS